MFIVKTASACAGVLLGLALSGCVAVTPAVPDKVTVEHRSTVVEQPAPVIVTPPPPAIVTTP